MIQPNAHIWKAAEEFCNAGVALMEGDIPAYPHPIIMNFAFSCELALKAAEAELVNSQGAELGGGLQEAFSKSVVRGHNLPKVFDNLSETSRKKIADEFKESTGNELREELEKYAEIFIQARYPFEPGGLGFTNMSRLQDLAVELLSAVRKLA